MRRLIVSLGRFLDKKLPGPKNAERAAWEMAWDYQQADFQPRDMEPNPASLKDALTVLHSDPTAALPLLLQLAHEGSPIAMNAVGEAYLHGRGAPADRLEAERWLKAAAEAGNLRAILTYGKLLLWDRRLSEAEAVLRPAAYDGFAPAAYWLARVEIMRSKWGALRVARPWLEQAAAQGSPGAKGLLGTPFALGLFGPRQIPRGWRLLRDYFKWTNQVRRGPQGQHPHDATTAPTDDRPRHESGMLRALKTALVAILPFLAVLVGYFVLARSSNPEWVGNGIVPINIQMVFFRPIFITLWLFFSTLWLSAVTHGQIIRLLIYTVVSLLVSIMASLIPALILLLLLNKIFSDIIVGQTIDVSESTVIGLINAGIFYSSQYFIIRKLARSPKDRRRMRVGLLYANALAVLAAVAVFRFSPPILPTVLWEGGL
jgi:hypothetical protein